MEPLAKVVATTQEGLHIVVVRPKLNVVLSVGKNHIVIADLYGHNTFKNEISRSYKLNKLSTGVNVLILNVSFIQ